MSSGSNYKRSKRPHIKTGHSVWHTRYLEVPVHKVCHSHCLIGLVLLEFITSIVMFYAATMKLIRAL
jgi:hypothetical protein